MKKKLIIYISLAIIILIGVILSIILINKNNEYEPQSTNNFITEKITIYKYEDSKIANNIQITDTNKLNDFTEIYNTIDLQENSIIAIKNDVRLDLNNGIYFGIQLDYADYCYYENANNNIKQIIRMPNGLLDFVNNLLAENN